MEAGRELDALIAVEVMGFTRHQAGTYIKSFAGKSTGIPSPVECFTDRGTFAFNTPPAYSTDIASAFDVVEKLQSQDWAFILDNMHGHLGHWQAHFEWARAVYQADADTPSHAICLAALRVVGINPAQPSPSASK